MSEASYLERYMLEFINIARGSARKPSVSLETTLNRAAEDYSLQMLEQDWFDHIGPDGFDPGIRMERAGFRFTGDGRWGENIAWVEIGGEPGLLDEVEYLHEALMDSPGHRENILHWRFRFVGIGIEVGEFQGMNVVMVTQNFANTSYATNLDTGRFWIGTDDRDGFYGSDDADMFIGLGGDDNIGGRGGADALYGDQGDDRIYGGPGDDRLEGGGGADLIYGGDDDDYIDGGGGRDQVQGNGGDDVIFGRWGNDRLEGHGGDDRLYGGDGDDRLEGGGGRNRLMGEAGDDRLTGGRSRDELLGNSGDDRLSGMEGGDVLNGGTGDDELRGHLGNDWLYGKDGDDRLDGGGGRDRLFGGAGADGLHGRSGDDRIDGGTGDDVLRGGEGRDVFVFGARDGRDRVLDFRDGQDLIEIDAGASRFGQLTLTDAGDDVVIRYAGTTITLVDETFRGIGASDFLFT